MVLDFEILFHDSKKESNIEEFKNRLNTYLFDGFDRLKMDIFKRGGEPKF